MFRSILNVAVCLVLLGGAISSQAQRVRRAAVPLADDQSCVFNFHSGSNNTFLKFCVTATGNIAQIETPQGHEQLDLGVGTDGYGICDATTAVSYFDYGHLGLSDNWAEPTVVSQTSKSVKIARSTSDGIWTLTQTISLVPATPQIKVVMALKNNTAIDRSATLLRYADINVDHNISGQFLNDFSATRNSAAGWLATVPLTNNFGTGLQMENVGNSQFGTVSGFAQFDYLGPDPCNFEAETSGTPLTDTDGSIVLAHSDSVGAKQTKMTTLIYKGF